MVVKILASAIAKQFTKETAIKISNFGTSPTLVAFLANDDSAAQTYAEWTSKTCEETGIKFVLRKVCRTMLEDAIVAANDDKTIHGIMVYYPVFGGNQDQYLQNTVAVEKDIEGLSHTYRYNMYHNIRYLDKTEKMKCIIPCTPLAIVKVLEYVRVYNPILPHGDRLHGKIITIINRSEVVGRPLAALLANDGAQVFSADENGLLLFNRGQSIQLSRHQVSETTITLEEALKQSDIVITGVPSKEYQLDATNLKDGVIALNFSTYRNFGDDVNSKASVLVSSIGKVTIAMLQRNLTRLYDYNQLRSN